MLCGSEHFPALSELDSPDAIARVRHYLDRFELLQGHYVALSQVIEPQKLRLLEQGQSCDFPREELEKYGAQRISLYVIWSGGLNPSNQFMMSYHLFMRN